MTKNDTCKRLLAAAAVLLAAAAMLHTLFVGLEIDEEYALSLGFRLVRGDRLFYSMWEPHQLSALPPALLIAAYTAVTGTTTGVLLFVRVTMLVVKAVLSVWFYRSLRAPLGRTSACLLALVLFVFTPKWFLGPDYVSQQFHFTLAAFLFFYGYYAPGPQQYRGLWRVAAGAVCACFSCASISAERVCASVTCARSASSVPLGSPCVSSAEICASSVAICALPDSSFPCSAFKSVCAVAS